MENPSLIDDFISYKMPKKTPFVAGNVQPTKKHGVYMRDI